MHVPIDYLVYVLHAVRTSPLLEIVLRITKSVIEQKGGRGW